MLTFAARTGSETNIHTVDTLRLERCFRDYAAMREAQDGLCCETATLSRSGRLLTS